MTASSPQVRIEIRSNPLYLSGVRELVSSVSKRLGFADFLHTLPDRPERDLPSRNFDALVGLGVRPKSDTRTAREVGHHAQVLFERVEIDDERRRIEGGEGLA